MQDFQAIRNIASGTRGLFLLGFVFLFSSLQLIAKTSLANLEVNYLKTPVGIDSDDLLFSWQLVIDQPTKPIQQTAYQIIVQSENNQTVWDSGKEATDISVGIRYQGIELDPRMRYSWTVAVWTNSADQVKESSWFETGLKDQTINAWNGATWIGGGNEDVVLAAHALTVFKLNYDIQIQKGSEKASLLFGGNDLRFRNKNYNISGLEVGHDESYIAVELDLSPLDSDAPARVNVYRVGFAIDDDPSTPLKSLPIPKTLLHEANKNDKHRLYLDVVFGTLNIHFDGQDVGHLLVPEEEKYNGVHLNPFGVGNDYITFPVLGDIGFKMEAGQQATINALQVRHFRAPSNVIFEEGLSSKAATIFETSKSLTVDENGYVLDGENSGAVLLADPSRNAAPMLRTSFAVERKRIKKARVYATARGIYELFLNGQRVSNDYFNPGLTQYNRHQLYQTFDVTALLAEEGDNVLGAILGEGWWSGNTTFKGENWNYFGDRQSFLAQLIITYEDGSEQIIKTQPKNWKLFTNGPVRNGSFFQGEIYDATKEEAIEGWSQNSYMLNGWKQAFEVPLDGNSFQGEYRDLQRTQREITYDSQAIVAQEGLGVTQVETLTAKTVTEVRPKVFVYDMGQNMVGVPKVEITNGVKGDTVVLRYAEVLYPDLPEYADNVGMIMLENIRAALSQDVYILKGGDETIHPRFTFHGYRYIEITGVENAPALHEVQGLVLSSVQKLASSFECSNPLVNQLWSNVTWSLRSNFVSIPTDCPARNERMGWNGDINVFAKAATWLADANPFLKRHLMAMRDMQMPNGRYSDVAPIGNGFGGTLWGSAGIVVAWELYQQYGDITLLEEHYPSMKAYVEYLATKQDSSGALVEGPLGDWLSPENSKNDNTLLWSAYQVYNLDILQQVARILGKEADALKFERDYVLRKNFFNDTYVNASLGKTVHSGIQTRGFGPPPKNPPQKGDEVDTQASYAIPLALGVFDESFVPVATTRLTDCVQRSNTDDRGTSLPSYSLMTGFIGTASIGQALSENNQAETMYKLLQAESYPSWLYPVKNGATTIWERLNSYTTEDGFGGNNNMNSFNHYAFGAVAAWMYNYCLGIERGPEGGFKHFALKPIPDPTKQMTFAKGHYESSYGRIESSWEQLSSGATNYRFVIPPNSSASVSLVAQAASSLDEASQTRLKNLSIPVRAANGSLNFTLPPGAYEFTVSN